MMIDPNCLREARQQKGLSHAELAERSKISKRQIARLESKSLSSGKPRERTIKELAKALQVEPRQLTGEEPLPQSEPQPPRGEPSLINALVMPEGRLAYDLIKRRYGINQTEIINMAPLFFVLLAEQSFLWRRKKLDEVREAADRLTGLVGDKREHLAFVLGACQVLNCAHDEESSIENRDLFGAHVAQDTIDFGYDRFTHNPFADFLRKLARQIDYSCLWVDPDSLHDEYYDFPAYKVCGEELEKITGGSIKAQIVLEHGYARISDIPDELWAENTTDARVKWLEEKYSEVPYFSEEELLNLFDAMGDGNEETGK